MADIGEPIRRITVIPIHNPVMPTPEPIPPLPVKEPVKEPEKEPA